MSSNFFLTDAETGNDIELVLLGFTDLDKKVYAVCCMPNDSAEVVVFQLKKAEKNGFAAKITRDAPKFLLVENEAQAKKVLDRFYETELA